MAGYKFHKNSKCYASTICVHNIISVTPRIIELLMSLCLIQLLSPLFAYLFDCFPLCIQNTHIPVHPCPDAPEMVHESNLINM